MVIFQGYVSLPEGTTFFEDPRDPRRRRRLHLPGAGPLDPERSRPK